MSPPPRPPPSLSAFFLPHNIFREDLPLCKTGRDYELTFTSRHVSFGTLQRAKLHGRYCISRDIMQTEIFSTILPE